MNQLATTNMLAKPREYSPAQLQLVKRTVAKDCNDDEFNMFMEICRRQNLDPFRRQIYAFVFNKDREEKRQFVTVTGIDGYRAIAKRTGTYRPDEKEPVIEYDPALKNPESNPEGIVKASVTVHQYGPDGQWHPISGTARWNEFAPIEEEVKFVDQGEVWPDSGKPRKSRVPTGKKKLSKDNWRDMPHVMIAKCAEAQALRRGWPEEFSGIYTFDELDRVKADLTASDIVAEHEKELRLQLVNGADSYPLVFNMRNGIEMVPSGNMADRVLEFVQGLEAKTEVELWMETNRAGLQQYWAREKADALELKKQIAAIAADKPEFKDLSATS